MNITLLMAVQITKNQRFLNSVDKRTVGVKTSRIRLEGCADSLERCSSEFDVFVIEFLVCLKQCFSVPGYHTEGPSYRNSWRGLGWTLEHTQQQTLEVSMDAHVYFSGFIYTHGSTVVLQLGGLPQVLPPSGEERAYLVEANQACAYRPLVLLFAECCCAKEQ